MRIFLSITGILGLVIGLYFLFSGLSIRGDPNFELPGLASPLIVISLLLLAAGAVMVWAGTKGQGRK